jgi:PAS domain S-box-containing protein
MTEILHLESNTADAELIAQRLSAEGLSCNIERVENVPAFEAALQARRYDIILFDFDHQSGNGQDILLLALTQQPGTPVIALSTAFTDVQAATCLRAGATDCVLKNRLARLAPVIERVLREANDRRERDVTALALQVSENRQTLALEAARVTVWEYDLVTGAVNFSRQLGPMLGYTEGDVPARIEAWEARTHPDDLPLVRKRMGEHFHGASEMLDVEYRVRMKNGNWRWLHTMGRIVARDEAGRALRMAGTHRDVSEIKTYQIELEYRANFDALTGLVNKSLLADRLDRATAAARRSGEKLALLYLDLDRVKGINDSLGHAAGDELLKGVAKRLLGCVRHSDTVARLGGDEFAVLLTQIDGAASAAAIAREILR